VKAWYSAQNPDGQPSQLGSVWQVRIGTQPPQQAPSTDGTSPGGQVGGRASQSTPFGLQITALPPPTPLPATDPPLPPLPLVLEAELALVAPPLPAELSDVTSLPQATRMPRATKPKRVKSMNRA
jgi:hypothetical protein